MKRILCVLCAITVTALAVPAQIIIKRPAPEGEIAQQAESRFDTLFYKAFYLENGEKKLEQAARLYREYLDRTDGKGRFVKKSAGRLARLLRRQGDEDGATALTKRFGLRQPNPQRKEIQEIRKRIKELSQSKDPAAAAEMEELKRKLAEMRGGDGTAKGEREEWIQQATQRIERLREQIKRMEASGEGGRRLEFMKSILQRQEATLAKVKSGDMEPPRRNERRGFGRRRNLQDMSPEEREQMVGRMLDRARQGVTRMKEQGQEKEAQELEANIKKAEKLLKEGKWEELQQMFRQLMRRGGRRPRRPEGQLPPGGGELRPGFRRPGRGGGEER